MTGAGGDDDVLQVEQVGVPGRGEDRPARVGLLRVGSGTQVAAAQHGQDPATAQDPRGEHPDLPIDQHRGGGEVGECDIH